MPESTLSGINSYLDGISNREGSGYGYLSPQVTPSMTAAGLLCREYLGWEAKRPALVKGVENLMKFPPNPNFRNTYYYYYATQVIHHFGGEPWEREIP